MPRLILLLAVIAVLYLMYRRVQTVPPHKRRAEYIKLGLAVAVAVVLVLTLTGRMHWLGIAATGSVFELAYGDPDLGVATTRWILGLALPGTLLSLLVAIRINKPA